MHQQFKPINYLEQQGLVQNCVLFIILFRTTYVKYICLLAISQPNRLRCVRRNPPFPAGESARVVDAPGAWRSRRSIVRCSAFCASSWRRPRFAFRSSPGPRLGNFMRMPEPWSATAAGRVGPSDVLGNPVAHRPVGRHHLR